MSPMRTRALVLAVAALLAVVGVVLLTSGSGDEGEPAVDIPGAEAAFAESPPPIRGLYNQRNILLTGGRKAFDARIEQLRGYPVVVNKWASWCGPCRIEFPVFRKAAIQEAGRIAFVGLDTNDNDGDAREFLGTEPIPYPSYVDPDGDIARRLKAPVAFPATAFYDKNGRLAYTHQGPYDSVDELLRDVRKYTGA
jgi:cytochrome c biogenesis protein CcmG/thiol:disulfide interchange protein DsbE